MTITVERIDFWRSAKSETQNMEFKEAKRQFDNKKLYRYCVALANEGAAICCLGLVVITIQTEHKRVSFFNRL